MAADVALPVIIKVQQSLHGYSDGHRQLACSLKLSPRDTKLVLVMSDVSGSGVASEGVSYLTGYPLVEAGMYALAQTWSAPEMPRPGCVWTHTLFIEFPDLAAISSPSRLAELFVRPHPSAWSTYNLPTTIDLDDADAGADEQGQLLTPRDEDWLAAVLNSLYQFPQDRVLAKRDPTVSAEALTLRIWDQQWPRLRRSFRFCTLTTMDRSTSGATFDLQVAPGNESSSRVRLSGLQEATPVADLCYEDWLRTLIQDVRHPNLDGLRDTLKTLGADILGGREAMPSLCDFHRLTSRSASPSALDEAIRMVEVPGQLSSSDMARAQVAEHLLSRVEDAREPALAFLWNNWHYIDPDKLRRRLPDVAGSIWRASPRRLLEQLGHPSKAAGDWAAQVIKALPAESLVEHWPDGEAPFRELLTVRPDLLDMPSFWRAADVGMPIDFQGIDLSSDGTVDAMVQGLATESAMRSAVQLVGPMRVLDALQRLSGFNDLSGFRHWLWYCFRNPSVAAEFLSRVETPSVVLLQALARVLDPDSVPNDYGDDPWLVALVRLRASTGSVPMDLAAYAFNRALGWSSRSVAELLQLTFEPLHGAASTSSLDDAHWRLIERRLPWVPENDRWDRGRRLRAIVASSFVDKRLWPRAFAWMATSNEVFVALMDETLHRFGGRRFLQDVEDSLKSESDAHSQARQELIRDFLRARMRK